MDNPLADYKTRFSSSLNQLKSPYNWLHGKVIFIDLGPSLGTGLNKNN